MKFYVHCCSEREIPGVERLRSRLGLDLVVISDKLELADHYVATLEKDNTLWSLRWLRLFLATGEPCCVKLDPDTHLAGLIPEIPDEALAAGDFRETWAGPIWLGAYQFITRALARLLVSELPLVSCEYQDIELARVLRDVGIPVFNSPHINGWRSADDEQTPVFHWGRSRIARKPAGILIP